MIIIQDADPIPQLQSKCVMVRHSYTVLAPIDDLASVTAVILKYEHILGENALFQCENPVLFRHHPTFRNDQISFLSAYDNS